MPITRLLPPRPISKREAVPSKAPTGPKSGPKLQKTSESADKEAIKVLEKEAEDALKALRYEQLREGLNEVKALEAQGWTIDDKDVARNQDLEAMVSTVANLKWWINNCDIDHGQLVRAVAEYPDDAEFYNLYDELIQDMFCLLNSDHYLDCMDRRLPEKQKTPISEELVQMQQYFIEHEPTWEI